MSHSQLLIAAHEYRRVRGARTPLLVIENPVMHGYAKRLTGRAVSQYVQPYHHGTGHTKSTGLEIVGLPDLAPSCPVEGRQHAMARLPPTPDRRELRSQSYLGIAGAMAQQWMPAVSEYVQHQCTALEESGAEPDVATASEMIEMAKRATKIRAAKLCLYHRKRDGQLVVYSYARKHRKSLDLFGGTFDAETDEDIASTLMREIREELHLPSEWLEALRRTVAAYPKGQTSCCCHRRSANELHNVYVWAVPLSDREVAMNPSLTEKARVEEVAFNTEHWRPLVEVTDDLNQYDFLKPYASAIMEAVRVSSSPVVSAAIDQASKLAGDADDPSLVGNVEIPHTFRPWETCREPLRRKPPDPKLVKLKRGKWKAWAAQPLHDRPGEHAYGWEPLSSSLQNMLNLELHSRHDIDLMPPIPEQVKKVDVLELSADHCRNERSDAKLKAEVAELRLKQAQTSEGNPDSDLVEKWRVAAIANVHAIDAAFEDVNPSGDHVRSPVIERSRLLERDQSVALIEVQQQLQRESLRTEWLRIEQITSASGREIAKQVASGDKETLSEVQRPCFEGGRSQEPTGAWTPSLLKTLNQIEQWARRNRVPFNRGQVMRANARAGLNASFARSSADDPSVALPVANLGTTAPPSPPDLEETGETFTCDDIVRPVAKSTVVGKTSLFLPGVSVCRHAGTRKGIDKLYRVDQTTVVKSSLMDSGAAPSYVTDQLLEKMPRDAVVERDPYAIVPPLDGPDGAPLSTLGTATLLLNVQGVKVKQTVIVGRGKPILILGNDFLDSFKANIAMNVDGVGGAVATLQTDKGERKVQLSTNVAHARVANVNVGLSFTAESDATAPATSSKDRGATGSTAGSYSVSPLPTIDPPSGSPEEFTNAQLRVAEPDRYFLHTGEAVTIPARSRATLWLACPRDLAHDKVRDYFIDRLPVQEGMSRNPPVVIPSFVTPNAHDLIQVVVWNRKDRMLTLPAFAAVATLEVGYTATVLPPEEGNVDYVANLPPAHLKLLDTIPVDPEKRLNSEQKSEVRQLLAKHIRAFALDPKNPAHTQLMRVRLPLKEGARPHRHGRQHLGEAGKEIVDKQIKELEAANIIRKSNSEWSSRIVLVGKKGGATRMCIDFRDLNSKLVTLDTPIPLTLDALDRLGGGNDGGASDSLFLSVLDLASGFWTLPIAEEDKGLTAFSDGRQKWEWNYLPFGVQSGPSYMCRLMEQALDGLTWNICMPYLDDCGIWATGVGATLQEREDASFKQMLHRLDLVLERFENSGMTCKAEKCSLFATQAEYLGHLVTREGIKMDPKKIQAVSEVDPTSLNDVSKIRSFLGLTGYYRRFIKQYSRISAPLSDLTQDGVDVLVESHSEKCQKAIKELKEK